MLAGPAATGPPSEPSSISVPEEGARPPQGIEVTHAHHSDSTARGYDNRYVPLGHYFQQALDLMWARLTEDDRPLPPSQVVRTVPRGGEPGHAPALARANVPAIAPSPAPGDRISVRSDTVRLPGCPAEHRQSVRCSPRSGVRGGRRPSRPCARLRGRGGGRTRLFPGRPLGKAGLLVFAPDACPVPR